MSQPKGALPPIPEELMRTAALTQVCFLEAANAWLETRRGHITPRTAEDYRIYINKLSRFFGEFRLHEITPDMVRAYQRDRRSVAGPSLINKELGVLKMMRERIGLPLQDYQRLQQPKDWESPGRALTDPERETVEKVCKIFAEHPRWKVAAFAVMLAMKSGLTRAEMLSLKLKNCSLDPPWVEIPRRGAKRQSRERVVHLGADGAWALENLITRAMDECGAGDAEHFLFPFQNHDRTFDPTKPGRHYRSGLRKIFECAGLTDFKPNYFRHDAVSKALSNSKVPLQAAVRHFGWISPKMVQKYYHESQKESQLVAAAIEARKEAEPVKKLWMPKRINKVG